MHGQQNINITGISHGDSALALGIGIYPVAVSSSYWQINALFSDRYKSTKGRVIEQEGDIVKCLLCSTL